MRHNGIFKDGEEDIPKLDGKKGNCKGKKPPYDGSLLGNDPNVSPGEDWRWRGAGDPKSGKGNWYNGQTGESLHPDLAHYPPIGPHWDYLENGGGDKARLYPDSSWEWAK